MQVSPRNEFIAENRLTVEAPARPCEMTAPALYFNIATATGAEQVPRFLEAISGSGPMSTIPLSLTH